MIISLSVCVCMCVYSHEKDLTQDLNAEAIQKSIKNPLQIGRNHNNNNNSSIKVKKRNCDIS